MQNSHPAGVAVFCIRCIRVDSNVYRSRRGRLPFPVRTLGKPLISFPDPPRGKAKCKRICPAAPCKTATPLGWLFLCIRCIRADSNVYRSRRGRLPFSVRTLGKSLISFPDPPRGKRNANEYCPAAPCKTATPLGWLFFAYGGIRADSNVYRSRRGRLPFPVRTLGKALISFPDPPRGKRNANEYCPAAQNTQVFEYRLSIYQILFSK